MTRPAKSEVGSSSSFVSIKSESDKNQQRMLNDTECKTNEQMYESQGRPGLSKCFAIVNLVWNYSLFY